VADFWMPPQRGRGGQQATGEADDAVQGAMELEDALVAGAGGLVEPIDVLGRDRTQPLGPLERDECAMPGTRFGRPRGMMHAFLPGPGPDRRISQVSIDREEGLRRGILGPHALRTAEVRDARLRADARTRQHGHASGFADPPSNALDRRIHDPRV
jgi:hypothetical protein